MANDNNSSKTSTEDNQNAKEEKSLPIHNPLDPNDTRQLTEEDLENEQKYKEALTERD